MKSEGVLEGLVVKSDEEIARLEQQTRAEEAGIVRDRLPEYLRSTAPETLLERVKGATLVNAATRWMPSRGGLMFIAPTKHGKSAAAGYLFRRLLGRGVKQGGPVWDAVKRMQWFAAVDLERARLEHPLGKGDAPEILDATHASILVIDDLGWDRDPRAVSEVLHARYERERVTVVTTSRSMAELDTRYGGATLRRMLEAGGRGCTVVEAAP